MRCNEQTVIGPGYKNSGDVMRCVHEEGHQSNHFFSAVELEVIPVGDAGCTSGFEFRRKPKAS